MTSLAVRLALVLGLAFAVGCTGSSVVEQTPAALTGSIGVLRVERSIDGESQGRAVLGAAFARYRDIDGADVARLLWGASEASEVDTCVESDGASTGIDAEPSAEVELVDVGALDLRVDDLDARLVPRTFPELGSVATGVFYASETVLPTASPRASEREYTVRASGGREIGAFDATLLAPPDLTGLRVNGAAPADVAWTPGRELDLAWDGSDSRDRVEVEFWSGEAVVRCSARDDGAFRVPTPTGQGAARLVVRRVRVTAFDAPGFDEAYARMASLRAYELLSR